MQKLTINEILIKYEAGECTEEETAIVETFYLQLPDNQKKLSDADLAASLERVSSRLPVQPKVAKNIRLWPGIAAAVIVILGIAFGGYFLLEPGMQKNEIVQNQQNPIDPGRSRATLTLANGRRIILIKGMAGIIGQQGNSIIKFNHQNEVSYTSSSKVETVHTIYNTLSTSAGEQSPCPLVLTDGTKIWLNAMSSVTFPAGFKTRERIVKITGEAYIEVSHDVSRPFRVMVKDQIIDDIGTRFNINAYDDEPSVNTVLLEGKVKVSQGKHSVYLNPGKQAVNRNGQLKVIDATAEAIAWKEGYFSFNDSNIKTVMRVISRWYNIKVDYENDITTDGFSGKISRLKNLQEILELLSSTGLVHFKLDGRKISVTK